MMRKLLTIIIPVRSEEEMIRDTIELVEKMVQTPHTIMIADDTTDPSDRTVEIVRSMQFSHPERSEGSRGDSSSRISGAQNDTVFDIVISKKRAEDAGGFGPALVRASKKATTPYIVFVMADLCDDLNTIDRMVSEARENKYDMVVGCRYMKAGKKIGGPVLQGVFSTLVNAFLFRVAGIPTRDATNAFKLYRTKFLHRILPVNPEIGVEFSLQLTIQAVIHHARMLDIPTVWHGREKGHSKVWLFSRGPKYMKLVIEALRSRFI